MKDMGEILECRFHLHAAPSIQSLIYGTLGVGRLHRLGDHVFGKKEKKDSGKI